MYRTAVLFAALIAVRLPFLLAGPGAQLSLMSDDAFYYIEAARRTVESGHWPSMDGRNPTNGFHPLYMAALVALQRLFGTSPERVIPMVLGLNLALNGASAWLLVRAWGSEAARGAAFGAGLLWALNPAWAAHGLAGVETNLSALILLLLALRWRALLRGEAVPDRDRPWPWIGDGLLAGVAILARTDSSLFVALGLAAAFLVRARTRGVLPALRPAAVTALVAVLVSLPWWVTCLQRFGSVSQDSAVAIACRTTALAGPPDSPAAIRLALTNLAFWAYRLVWTWGLIPLTGWLVGMSIPRAGTATTRFSLSGVALAMLCVLSLPLRHNDLWYIDRVAEAGLQLALGFIALAGGWLTSRESPPRFSPWGLFLATYVALIALIYTFGLRAFQVWYTTGPALVAIALPTGEALVGLVARRTRTAAVLIALMIVQTVVLASGYLSRGGFEGISRDALERGRDLRARLESMRDAAPGPLRFGSFDSGKLSYLVHPFPVSNLDGVMNHSASRALHEGLVREYLREQGITHIISPRERIAEFQRASPFEVTADSTASRVLGHPVFRVVHSE